MIDLKAIETEVRHARQARLDAEAASSDVEDMIREVQHLEPGRGRLFFFVQGFELGGYDAHGSEAVRIAAPPLAEA